MRSSKSRSRSKQNRPRSIGNIVNRVFDSSGPEGKVRGTPQQIIEKYQTLARDAQLSNDRVAAENFLQHAEHYTRMLGEAMRELAAEQEARRNQPGGNGGQQGDRPGYPPRRDQREDDQPDIGPVPVFAFDEGAEDSETGLVETPEARSEPPRAPQNQGQRHDRRDAPRRDDRPTRDEQARREDQPRRDEQPRREDRKPRPEHSPRESRRDPLPAAEPEAAPAPAAQDAPAAPAAAPEAKPRRARAPRKPKDTAAPDTGPGSEAAE